MTAHKSERLTIRQWLATHARDKPVHYTDIAEALGRDPASVSASLSIERRQARRDERPPYFVRVGPGLYRYNDLCEGAIDEDSIAEVRSRAQEFNLITRNELARAIADLDLEAFKRLAEIVLVNTRARPEDIMERERYNGVIVMTTSWLDDSGRSPVVIYVKKCGFDERIEKETIFEIRGLLPKYGANQGILLSNGIVTESALGEALGPEYASVPPVHIMDKEIMLSILLESRTGVRVRNVEVYLLDRAFFESLKDE
ncbi:MAG: restriction endonuclease [Candidatus Thorarchaeota archaeon]